MNFSYLEILEFAMNVGISQNRFSANQIPSFVFPSFVTPRKTFPVLSFSVSCVNPKYEQKHICLLYATANLAFRWPFTQTTHSVINADQRGIHNYFYLEGPEFFFKYHNFCDREPYIIPMTWQVSLITMLLNLKRRLYWAGHPLVVSSR